MHRHHANTSTTQKSQHDINQQQYHQKSDAYLNSTVHAQGIEFAKMQQLVGQYPAAQVLDLGCGGGHVSYQVAANSQQVTAYDLSAEMVDLVVAQAGKKGMHQIVGQVGPAEHLDFADHHFDVVLSRYSAHHWQDLAQALQQIYRVLKPQGKVILFDTLGSEHPSIDTFIQSIEFIRDPSHVRNYSLAQWVRFAEYAGFQVEVVEIQHLELDFKSWVERMQTPETAVQSIRYLHSKVSDMVRRYFNLQADGTFSNRAIYLQLSKI
ncbi:ubiquinone/menaquinone biosynthesis C-methylase UbiE [Acinetobacter calcoaceticus]|uniref:Ubiquinone/menaquinone biosynthesis C-methylase UbiE n=1 Tax=Acinetobacter calcoaceticus TaxID=471 RepID=A0A4R1XUI3_ACICA|nr:ubiquinone/menaquinone biosynthesis C-methylase UbiE [Acinetobacter calcoaceticus]